MSAQSPTMPLPTTTTLSEVGTGQDRGVSVCCWVQRSAEATPVAETWVTTRPRYREGERRGSMFVAAYPRRGNAEVTPAAAQYGVRNCCVYSSGMVVLERECCIAIGPAACVTVCRESEKRTPTVITMGRYKLKMVSRA